MVQPGSTQRTAHRSSALPRPCHPHPDIVPPHSLRTSHTASQQQGRPRHDVWVYGRRAPNLWNTNYRSGPVPLNRQHTQGMSPLIFEGRAKCTRPALALGGPAPPIRISVGHCTSAGTTATAMGPRTPRGRSTAPRGQSIPNMDPQHVRRRLTNLQPTADGTLCMQHVYVQCTAGRLFHAQSAWRRRRQLHHACDDSLILPPSPRSVPPQPLPHPAAHSVRRLSR